MDQSLPARDDRAQYAVADRIHFQRYHLPGHLLTQVHHHHHLLPTHERRWAAVLGNSHRLQWICRLQYCYFYLDRKNNKFKEYRESRGAMKMVLRKGQ